jgi:3'-phosphoadenosine 5'-phosphosulfate (PAPS) 3'-phosphatase
VSNKTIETGQKTKEYSWKNIDIEHIITKEKLQNIINLLEKTKQEFVLHKNIKIMHKWVEDETTDLDKKINKLILNGIKNIFPEDWFLSEESKDNTMRLTKKRVWIIDPVDWTWNLINYLSWKSSQKYKNFAIHIGLVSNWEPELWIMYLPIKDILYIWIKWIWSFTYKNWKSERIFMAKIDKEGRDIECAWSVYRNDKTKSISEDSRCKKETLWNVFGCCILSILEWKNNGYICFPPEKNRLWEWDLCAPYVIFKEVWGIIKTFDDENIFFNQKDPYLNNWVVAINPWLLRNKKNIIKKDEQWNYVFDI